MRVSIYISKKEVITHQNPNKKKNLTSSSGSSIGYCPATTPQSSTVMRLLGLAEDAAGHMPLAEVVLDGALLGRSGLREGG